VNPLLLDIPEHVSTRRLSLRSYRPGDGPAYFQALCANRRHLFEFLPPEMMAWQTEADAEIRIRELMAEWQMRRHFLFGVWDQQTGACLGETYLANADWKVPCSELGYFLLAGSTGKGFATEAARGVIDFAFEHLKVIRIMVCSIRSGNLAA
jgi:RimJ/RimL family protein N-acetyltransferase